MEYFSLSREKKNALSYQKGTFCLLLFFKQIAKSISIRDSSTWELTHY